MSTVGAPRYTILVTIVEGRGFVRDPDCQLQVQCQFNDALFIENSETNSHSYPEILSTDPVEQTAYPIWDTELAWDLDAEVLDILRIEHASLKLNCFAVHNHTGQEHSLGHIILDLSSAFESSTAEEHWQRLTPASGRSNSGGFRGMAPELKIAFSIDDGISGTAPTIDTLLTSIESIHSDDYSHRQQQQQQQQQQQKQPQYIDSHDHYSSSHAHEDEGDEDLEDDGQVPSNHQTDSSFYDLLNATRLSQDGLVPRSPQDEEMRQGSQNEDSAIPVAVGQAMIPADVNQQGFLQLGLGRDFFVFTITIQSLRDIELIVQDYSDNVDMDYEAVHQGLYLYYTYLGLDIATDLIPTTNESGMTATVSPIEETTLRLKSSMESMYQYFRDGEELTLNLCHKDHILATTTIPLSVILLHGTANLFHASPAFYSLESAATETGFIEISMHVTRDLNTLSVPNTPAIRRTSSHHQSHSNNHHHNTTAMGRPIGGGQSGRQGRPPAMEVDTRRRGTYSTTASMPPSPQRHDYKFSIEMLSFKSLQKSLNNVSLRYNYRPFGPKTTQPPINVSRHKATPLPENNRTFQLCQTPEALMNQLQMPLVVQVYHQHPSTGQQILYASGQILLAKVLKAPLLESQSGSLRKMESTFQVLTPVEDEDEDHGVERHSLGEIEFACALEDLGEYFDSQQSEIFSTTPVHSMELHHQLHQNRDSFFKVESLSSATSGPEPRYGFQPLRQESALHIDTDIQDQSLSQQPLSSTASHFGEGYGDQERFEPRSAGGQRPASVRLSQVRHLSQAHQNNHPHLHHPYGKPTSPTKSNAEPLLDYQAVLKQQLQRQAELNREIEMDLLRRSPMSNLPRTVQQALLNHSEKFKELSAADVPADEDEAGVVPESSSLVQQKMKDLKQLDYQVQKQLIALEFRERKLHRAEEALARQQANFQKAVERQASSNSLGGSFVPTGETMSTTPAVTTPGSAGLGVGGPGTPSAHDYFLLQDRFRTIQQQHQLLEVEFQMYRQEHPAHINMTTIQEMQKQIIAMETNQSKLMNDVMFAKNYKDHYKTLWTHSLQEIAGMRQDLQMGMEIKMMQQSNEVDQLKLIGMTRSEADHGQDRMVLRGIKTELEMLQHQMNPVFPDDNMSWEQDERHSHGQQQQDEEEDDDQDSNGNRHRHGGQGLHQYQYPSSQQARPSSSQRQSYQQLQGGSSAGAYRQSTTGGFVNRTSAVMNNNNNNNKYHLQQSIIPGSQHPIGGGRRHLDFDQVVQDFESVEGFDEEEEEEEEEEAEDTLVDSTMMKSQLGLSRLQVNNSNQKINLSGPNRVLAAPLKLNMSSVAPLVIPDTSVTRS